MDITMIPVGGRVLIDLTTKEKETKSGLLTTTEQSGPKEGKIVALGTGKTNQNGEWIPWVVGVGDTILFHKHMAEVIKIEDKDYYLIGEPNILMITPKGEYDPDMYTN